MISMHDGGVQQWYNDNATHALIVERKMDIVDMLPAKRISLMIEVSTILSNIPHFLLDASTRCKYKYNVSWKPVLPYNWVGST